MIDVSWLTGAGITALVAAVAVFWRQARNVFAYASSALVLQKDARFELSFAVGAYIRAHYKRMPSGISVMVANLMPVDDQALATLVPFDMPSATSMWYGPHGLYVVKADHNSLMLFSLRFFSDPYALVKAAVEFDNVRKLDTDSGNFFKRCIIGTAGEAMSIPRRGEARDSEGEVARLSEQGWHAPILHIDKSFMYEGDRYLRGRNHADPMQGLAYTAEVHEAINAIKDWYTQREWYAERGIPWRTGVLTYGPGGTGKSSLALVVARTLRIPVYQYYLNTLRDKEFVEEWNNMRTPCVVALDDFDTSFHGREAVTNHKSLSFECVLNQISGINALNGVVLMVSTNKLEHIDPALGQIDEHGRPTRPGRIDRIICLGLTDETQRRTLASYTLKDLLTEDAINALVAEGEGTTPAQFQSMCINAAQHAMIK